MDADYVVVGYGRCRIGGGQPAEADPSVGGEVWCGAGPWDKDKFIHIPAASPKLFRAKGIGIPDGTEEGKPRRARDLMSREARCWAGFSSMNAMVGSWISATTTSGPSKQASIGS